MGFPNRRHGLGLALIIALLSPLGCTSAVNPGSSASASAPRIRVRLLAGVETVTLSCGVPPLYQLSTQSTAQPLNSPKNAVFTLSLGPDGWVAGNATLGGPRGTILHLQPDHDGSVSINNVSYRGRFRFIPAAAG